MTGRQAPPPAVHRNLRPVLHIAEHPADPDRVFVSGSPRRTLSAILMTARITDAMRIVDEGWLIRADQVADLEAAARLAGADVTFRRVERPDHEGRGEDESPQERA